MGVLDFHLVIIVIAAEEVEATLICRGLLDEYRWSALQLLQLGLTVIFPKIFKNELLVDIAYNDRFKIRGNLNDHFIGRWMHKIKSLQSQ
mgnify:CR=1 FL=1|tara:strand:- start:1278 stop:1547 length:270 start_codon:yes stop_codon:yes gene_type:complete